MIDLGGRSAQAAAERFRAPPWTRSTPAWLALDAQLETDHLARLIDHGVDRLDLTPLLRSFAGRGDRPAPPDLMLKIVLFEIQRGRTSPAQWYRDTKENCALHWLGRGIRPARSVWYAFAHRIGPYLDGWNQQVLHQARQQGLASGQRVSLDGTAVEAQASRHRLLNHEQLQRRRRLLDAAVVADAAGQEPAPRPAWMARTVRSRRRQQEQYQRAHAHLNERLAENRQRMPSARLEEKHVRISVTDPEAALGKDKLKVFRPLYNVQYVRDLDAPFIVAYDTFAHSSDAGTLVPMLRRTQQLLGRLPEDAVVDSGYVTALDLADAREHGVNLCGPWKENDYSARGAAPPKQWGKDRFTWDEAAREYRCPQGQALPFKGVPNRPRSRQRTERLELYQAAPATCAACPQKAQCCPKSRSGRHRHRSEHEALIEAHRHKMATPEAKALYKRRGPTVEPSFGDAKQHRGFRRVHGRGLDKAKAQTGLTVLAHNLWELVKGLLGVGPSKDQT
jgi:transposase